MFRVLSGFAFFCALAAVCAAGERVTVPVVVTDGEHFAQNVSADSLRLTEDKKPVRILNIESAPEEPLWVVALVEYSRALPTSDHGYYYYPYQDVAFEEAMMVYGLVKQLGEEDRLALAIFDARIELLQDFTNQYESIIGQLERRLINNLQGPFGNESLTFRCLSEAIARLRGKGEGRKLAVVLIGTGQDTFGGGVSDEIRQEARSAGIQIFFVRVGWQAVEQLSNDEDQYELRTGRKFDPYDMVGLRSKFDLAEMQGREIARDSGGTAFQMRFEAQGDDFAESIALWLRSRNLVTYEAPEIKPDGKLHKLKIEYLLEIRDPDGKNLKLKAFTVDGRRLPKPKKEKKP